MTARFLRQIPHAKVVDVSRAAHMVAGDQNDAFSDAVIALLEHDGIGVARSGLHLILSAVCVTSSTAEPQSRWCTMWLGAPMATEPVHFQVQTLRGATVTSPPIPPAKR